MCGFTPRIIRGLHHRTRMSLSTFWSWRTSSAVDCCRTSGCITKTGVAMTTALRISNCGMSRIRPGYAPPTITASVASAHARPPTRRTSSRPRPRRGSPPANVGQRQDSSRCSFPRSHWLCAVNALGAVADSSPRRIPNAVAPEAAHVTTRARTTSEGSGAAGKEDACATRLDTFGYSHRHTPVPTQRPMSSSTSS